MSDAPAAVEADDLEVRYAGGAEPAVTGVAMRVAAGGGLLVSGGAGSGKTSVLRGLLGMVPHGGRAAVLGAPVGDASARGRVGYGPQGEGWASGLRVREAVSDAVALRRASGASRGAVTADALERAGLGYVADWRTARLDAEGWRRLSLAVAVAGDPDLVVLDDPWVLTDTLREIAAARARGGAVVAAARRPAGLAPALGSRLVLIEGRAR